MQIQYYKYEIEVDTRRENEAKWDFNMQYKN